MAFSDRPCFCRSKGSAGNQGGRCRDLVVLCVTILLCKRSLLNTRWKSRGAEVSFSGLCLPRGVMPKLGCSLAQLRRRLAQGLAVLWLWCRDLVALHVTILLCTSGEKKCREVPLLSLFPSRRSDAKTGLQLWKMQPKKSCAFGDRWR